MKLEHLVWDTLGQYTMLPEGATVICGLSGGSDSVALCRILRTLAPRLHLRLLAAHVHHGIRGTQADEDADFCRRLAQSLDIEFYCAHYDVPALAREQGIGLEECARKVRYAYFTRLAECTGAAFIATAHHAGDALETALFHLARGTGLRGLSGIQPVRCLDGFTLIRPLICASKQQIEDYLAEVGADYRIDESNACDDYARNRIRHQVVPALEQVNPSLIRTSVHTLKTLRLEADFLKEQAQQAYSRITAGQSVEIGALLALHPALQSRVLEKLYHQAAGIEAAQLSSVHLDAAIALCRSSHASGLVNLPAGVSARREYGRLFFEKKEPADVQDVLPVPLIVGESTLFYGWKISVKPTCELFAEYKSIHNFFVDCSKIYGKLLVRPRLPGDRIHLAGHHCSASLKKLMIDHKIPQPQRRTWPVIVDSRGIVAVANFGVDIRAAIDADSRELFFIQIEKYKVEENLCGSPMQTLQKS